VGRTLRRDDGSAVYNWCWASPEQLFSVPSPARLMTIFYCLEFETSLTPKQWLPVPSPLTTRRATVEVFDQPPQASQSN
jgi:hypothetical protein